MLKFKNFKLIWKKIFFFEIQLNIDGIKILKNII